MFASSQSPGRMRGGVRWRRDLTINSQSLREYLPTLLTSSSFPRLQRTYRHRLRRKTCLHHHIVLGSWASTLRLGRDCGFCKHDYIKKEWNMKWSRQWFYRKRQELPLPLGLEITTCTRDSSRIGRCLAVRLERSEELDVRAY